MEKKVFFAVFLSMLIGVGSAFARGPSGGGFSGGGSRPSFSVPSRPASPSVPSIRPSTPSSPPAWSPKPAVPSTTPPAVPTQPAKAWSPFGSSPAPSAPAKPVEVWQPKATTPAPSGGVNSDVAKAFAEQKSKQNFDAYKQQQQTKAAAAASQKPASNYVNSEADRTRIRSLERQLDREKMRNWDRDQRDFYGHYSVPSTVVIHQYHEPYNPMFWLGPWMAYDMATRANFLYNHRDSMDAQHYQQMLDENVDLRERVQALESQNAPHDPQYVPDDFKGKEHLLYAKEAVDEAAQENSGHSFFFWLLPVGILCGLLYLGATHLKLFS